MQISGDIILKDIKYHFGSKVVESKNYGHLKKQLRLFCDGYEKIVDERLSQVQQFDRLATYSHVAEAMLDVRDRFQLTGNFSCIENLSGLVGTMLLCFEAIDFCFIV